MIWLLGIIIIVAITVSVFLGLPENFYSPSTSLYFFSALLQANAAIFSIYGVFVIFKLQSIKSSIDSFITALMQDRGRSIHTVEVIDFDGMNIDEKKNHVEEIKNDVTFFSELYRETFLTKSC